MPHPKIFHKEVAAEAAVEEVATLKDAAQVVPVDVTEKINIKALKRRL